MPCTTSLISDRIHRAANMHVVAELLFTTETKSEATFLKAAKRNVNKTHSHKLL